MLLIGNDMSKINVRSTLEKLRDKGSLSVSSVGSAAESELFSRMMSVGAITKERKGRGIVFFVTNKDLFDDFFSHAYPIPMIDNTRSASVKSYRDSKATGGDPKRTFLVLGKPSLKINGIEINVPQHSGMGLVFFGELIEKFETKKICTVENINSFLKASTIIGDDWIFIHPIGRIGNKLLKKLSAEEFLHWGDYDIEGLKEYARIKMVFQNATLYIPANLEQLTEEYGFEHNSLQKISSALLELLKTDKDVQRVYNVFTKTGHFIEQEGLHD